MLADRATRRVAPSYPPGLAQAGIAGEVLIEAIVDEEGNVISASGVSGDKLLAEAAIEAVKQWKFKPMKLGGEPVKVIGRIRFNFNH